MGIEQVADRCAECDAECRRLIARLYRSLSLVRSLPDWEALMANRRESADAHRALVDMLSEREQWATQDDYEEYMAVLGHDE